MSIYRKSDILACLLQWFEPAEIGLEKTPELYISKLVEVFHEVKRVLRDDGTLWIVIGDSYSSGGTSGGGRQGEQWKEYGNTAKGPRGGGYRYAPPGLKPKDLIGVPWMLAFALRADGWYLRQDIIWHKPNPMPESVKDRCTKAHEYIFLLSQSDQYYFDHEAMLEPADPKNHRDSPGVRRTAPGSTAHGGFTEGRHFEQRNKRDVWSVPVKPFKAAHFATFPSALIEPMILAGCSEGGAVYDPFFGAGTTGVVAIQHGRRFVGSELSPEYCKIAEARIKAAREEL